MVSIGLIISIISYLIHQYIFNLDIAKEISFADSKKIIKEYLDIGWGEHRGLPIPLIGLLNVFCGLYFAVYFLLIKRLGLKIFKDMFLL